MSNRRVAAYAIVVVGLAVCAGAASAQVNINEASKGVRVLEAEPEPLPAPVPEPAPAPMPAPKPAPVVKPAPPVTPVLKFCDRPFAQPDMKLASGAAFDRALAAKLNTGKRVVIDLAQPYKDEDPAPAAIAPWLSEVKAGGGTVQVKEYCDAARGALGDWIAKLFGVGKPKDATAIYRPARQFNVILHADALDKVITQVEFAPKSARASL